MSLASGRQIFGSPPSKLSTVSYPAKPSPDNSPGPRIPASQARKWLRVDEEGNSAYIKVAVGFPVQATHMPFATGLTAQRHTG